MSHTHTQVPFSTAMHSSSPNRFHFYHSLASLSLRRSLARSSLDKQLSIVVRNNQGLLGWSTQADEFRRSAEWTSSSPIKGQLSELRPVADIDEVRISPLRSFGEPVVRGVRTEVIAELVRAGDSPDMISELYELPRHAVDAAVRYELMRTHAAG